MPKTNFKVPYALNNNGFLVTPTQASKGEVYSCPGCSEVLIFRQGEIVSSHFSHPATNHCSAESALHKAAKFAIKNAVEHWINTGTQRPVIHNKCFLCHSDKAQAVPMHVTSVLLETRLSSGHVADLVLTDGCEQLLVIEIFVTHKVSTEKGKSITIPWIELEANQVLADPTNWSPVQLSLKRFGCKLCHRKFVQFKTECASLAKVCNVEIPKSDFLYGPMQCEKCGRWCIAFLWAKDAVRGRKAPRTVKLIRTTEYTGWSNICCWCNRPIAIWELRQRHAPFWFMNPSDASVEKRVESFAFIVLHYFDEVRPRSFDEVVPPRELWMNEEDFGSGD